MRRDALRSGTEPSERRRLFPIDDGRPRPLHRHRRAAAAVFAVVAGAIVVAAVHRAPVALVVPGPTIDVSSDVTIVGHPSSAPSGRYLLTTVRFERASVLRVLIVSALSLRQVATIDPDPERVARELRRFRESRVLAAAAAAQTAGLPVAQTPDGRPSALPFQVRFRERRILGGSAGLVYALVIADMLDAEDLSKGRVIAATGSISADGRVGPIDGMPAKAAAIARLRPAVVLVPSGNVYDAWRVLPRARPVDDLQHALAALRDR